MLTVTEFSRRAKSHPRVIIRPKVVVKAGTPAEKQQVVKIARQVIAEHRDVLVALKDR